MARTKDTFTVDELAEFFGLPSQSDVDENNWEYVADAGRAAEEETRSEHARYADEGDVLDESEVEKAREKWEQEAQAEIYGKWHGAVTGAAAELFGNIQLALEPVGKEIKIGRSRYHYKYKVVPATSWEASAEAVRVVIDGIGYAHVGYDLQEFLELGPWTPRQAVLEHLRTASMGYPEVYGSSSAQRIYENAW